MIKLDELIKKITAIGVPGIILVIAVGVNGYAGAVAITVALSALGGPFGMIGGITALGIISLISHTIAELGTEKVIEAVIREQLKNKKKDSIIIEINNYPITKGLKLKIEDYIKNIE